MTDLEFLKFVLYGDKYYESIMREDDESETDPALASVEDNTSTQDHDDSDGDNTPQENEEPTDEEPTESADSDDQSAIDGEEPEATESSEEETEEDSSEENSEEDNVEAEVTDSDVPDPSSNAEINKRINNMVTSYISNINQGMSKGFKIKTKDSNGQPVTTKTKISAVPLEGSKPVLDQQNKTLKFKIRINKDSSGETGMSKFLRGANAVLGGVVNTVK